MPTYRTGGEHSANFVTEAEERRNEERIHARNLEKEQCTNFWQREIGLVHTSKVQKENSW